jgi:thioredoxin-like negative regulator of GroEL
MHLPKYALSGSPSGMEVRLQAALTDPTLQDQSGEVQAASSRRSRQRSTDVALAARIQHLASAGSIERAAAALDRQPLAHNTPEAIHHLRTLHFLEPAPTIPAVDVPPITCDEETLAQVARGLKRGNASGECEDTYEMLQAAIFGCPAGLRTCLAFFNAMLAFTIPRSTPS